MLNCFFFLPPFFLFPHGITVCGQDHSVVGFIQPYLRWSKWKPPFCPLRSLQKVFSSIDSREVNPKEGTPTHVYLRALTPFSGRG